MITIYVKDFNGDITQKSYDDIINNLDLNRLRCPNCNGFNMLIHGYYFRSVKTCVGKIALKVLRVICPYCHKTHALLLSTIIPYQSIQLKDQLRIIQDDDIDSLMIENNGINEIDIVRVKENYNNFYKELLISEGIKLDDNLIINCFKYFKRQFLQIKRRLNILFNQYHVTWINR